MAAEPRIKLSREEIALAEVGHTTIGRGTAWTMVAVFLAIICSIPLIEVVTQLRAPVVPGTTRVKALDLLVNPPRIAEFTVPIHWQSQPERNRLHEFERLVEDSSAPRLAVQPLLQDRLVAWGGTGNSQVVRGSGDWLFYRPGVDYCSGPGFLGEDQHRIVPRPFPDAIAAILALHQVCAARGVRLVILPMPDKAMIHPEKLAAGLAGVAIDNPDYERFAVTLAGAGVEVWRPLGLLRRLAADGDAFLHQDSHWTPETMDAVAESLARHLELPPAKQPRAWNSEPETVSRVGDLVDTLKLTPGQDIFAPEQVVIGRIRDAGDGHAWAPTADAEVLLLGDSFSNIYSAARMGWGENAGFGAHLALHLERDVDVIAINGGGASATRQELAKRRGGLSGTKVLVWQFSIRDLAKESWKPVDWSALAAERSAAATPASTEARHLLVELVTVSEIQAPSKADYAEAVTTLRAKVVDGTAAKELLLIAPCMHQRRLLPAAAWKAGDRLRVTVVPWAAMPGRHGEHRYDDTEVYDLDEWWVDQADPP